MIHEIQNYDIYLCVRTGREQDGAGTKSLLMMICRRCRRSFEVDDLQKIPSSHVCSDNIVMALAVQR